MLNTEDKPALRIEDLQLPKQRGFLAIFRRRALAPTTAPAHDELRLQKKSQLGAWVFLFIGFLPTVLTGVYLVAFSTDRYVSIASFVVRTASKPAGGGGFGALLEMVGFSRSDDDVFSVQDFLTSRDAVAQLSQRLPLREYFSHSGRDYIMSYPTLLYGNTSEQFYSYMQNFIDVNYNTTTGITTLTVQAFRPGDADKIASTLLTLAEEKVNQLNQRIRRDAIRVADDEVERSEARLSDAMVKVTAFRNRELMLDPEKNSVLLADLIGQLGQSLAETQSLATEKEGNSPNDPGLPALRQHAAALQGQIQSERDKIRSNSTGLADKLADYERLKTESDFAKTALSHALDALDAARTEARRQQLFLERIVNPRPADYPTMPASLWTLFTVFCVNAVALMIFWLLRTGLKEHAQTSEQ